MHMTQTMLAVIDTELVNKITEQGIAFLFDYGPKLLMPPSY